MVSALVGGQCLGDCELNPRGEVLEVRMVKGSQMLYGGTVGRGMGC